MMSKLVGVSVLAVVVACSAFSESAPVAEPQTWQPYDGAQISFDVLRKGKPFGTHAVTFDVADDGSFTATTDVDLKVKIGPFTAFQYALDSVETWRGDQLVALKGKTNDDGKRSFVSAKLDNNALTINGSAFSGTIAAGIIPSSHWNREQVQSDEMLSTESGEVLSMQIVPKGRETVRVAGEMIEADRYLLDSDIDIDLWYDDRGRWVKLTFDARGQTIEYRLSQLY